MLSTKQQPQKHFNTTRDLQTLLARHRLITFLKNILQVLNNPICQSVQITAQPTSNFSLGHSILLPTPRATIIFSVALLSDHLTLADILMSL